MRDIYKFATRYRLGPFKHDYTIFHMQPQTDAYGNVQAKRSGATETIHVMWTPVDTDADVQMYGRDVSRMVRAVCYETCPIRELDQVEIDGETYEIVQIRYYNTYRYLYARKTV